MEILPEVLPIVSASGPRSQTSWCGTAREAPPFCKGLLAGDDEACTLA